MLKNTQLPKYHLSLKQLVFIIGPADAFFSNLEISILKNSLSTSMAVAPQGVTKIRQSITTF